MKRLFALLCSLCLLLCACGGEPETPATTSQPTTQPQTETTDPATVPSTNLETEPTEPATEPPEPTEPPVVYRHPLTGEVLETPYEGRVTAVVINNIEAALPHYGVSEADMFYELETESGITRCLALYSDVGQVGTIGPIRSSRTFFNSIAQAYDGIVVHCGGSVRGRNAYHDINGSKISGWEHVDATTAEEPYFFRDRDRYNYQGYNWEHTLFATGEGLEKALEKKAYNEPRELDTGLTFAEDAKLGGFVANQVTVSFREGKTTGFTYNPETGLYEAEQYGETYVDAANGQQMSFKNVIVIYTPQRYSYDGEYTRSYYDLVGEGEAHIAMGGEIMRIRWSRADLDSPFQYTLEDGTPVTLGVGKTYVAVTSTESTPADYE